MRTEEEDMGTESKVALGRRPMINFYPFTVHPVPVGLRASVSSSLAFPVIQAGRYGVFRFSRRSPWSTFLGGPSAIGFRSLGVGLVFGLAKFYGDRSFGVFGRAPISLLVIGLSQDGFDLISIVTTIRT